MSEQFNLPCPSCGGEKKQLGFFPRYADSHTGPRPPVIEITCPTCDGEGMITIDRAANMAEGKRLRQIRIAAGYGLRQMAEMLAVLPSEWSQVEQGKLEVAECHFVLLKQAIERAKDNQ